MATQVAEFHVPAATQLDHLCNLRFDFAPKYVRQTGIVCTIGNASQNVDILAKMIKGGMTIARLNLSHDSHDFHTKSIEMIREASEIASNELGYNVYVGIAVDLKGPEIRTGILDSHLPQEIELKYNDMIKLTTNRDLISKGNKDIIYIDYPLLMSIVKPDQVIYINDGAIMLIVKEVAVDCVQCVIEIGGMLGSRKIVTFPGRDAELPAVSEKDRFDLKFAIDNNIDIVFASRLRNVQTVTDIRKMLGPKGRHMLIVAKIENTDGIRLMEDLIEAADGILFARHDVGIEVAPERLFLVQKAVMAHCNKAGKPIICATQVLESMRYRKAPTRAEVFDLGNIILDGADCIMLATETSLGDYPAETVAWASKVCVEAEMGIWYETMFDDLVRNKLALLDAAHAVAISAVETAKKSSATAIIVITTTGKSAYLVSRYRPRCPIFAVTRCSRTARQANLYRGIYPFLYTAASSGDWTKDVDFRIQHALLAARKMGVVDMGDAIVVVSSWRSGKGVANSLRVIYAFYEHEHVNCAFDDEFKGRKHKRESKNLG